MVYELNVSDIIVKELRRSTDTMWKLLLLNPMLIQKVFGFGVEAVQAVQIQMTDASPEAKKKEALEAANALYDIADEFAHFPEDVDNLVKGQIMPVGVESALNMLKAGGLFGDKNKAES